MKYFLSKNWYKLMIGSSLLMASFGFMVLSITHVIAQSPKNSTKSTLTNSEGIITVKLTDEQLRLLQPKAIQEIDIKKVNGRPAGCYEAYRISGEGAYYGLATKEVNPW